MLTEIKWALLGYQWMILGGRGSGNLGNVPKIYSVIIYEGFLYIIKALWQLQVKNWECDTILRKEKSCQVQLTRQVCGSGINVQSSQIVPCMDCTGGGRCSECSSCISGSMAVAFRLILIASQNRSYIIYYIWAWFRCTFPRLGLFGP